MIGAPVCPEGAAFGFRCGIGEAAARRGGGCCRPCSAGAAAGAVGIGGTTGTAAGGTGRGSSGVGAIAGAVCITGGSGGLGALAVWTSATGLCGAASDGAFSAGGGSPGTVGVVPAVMAADSRPQGAATSPDAGCCGSTTASPTTTKPAAASPATARAASRGLDLIHPLRRRSPPDGVSCPSAPDCPLPPSSACTASLCASVGAEVFASSPWAFGEPRRRLPVPVAMAPQPTVRSMEGECSATGWIRPWRSINRGSTVTL